jgi:hypothetical protein
MAAYYKRSKLIVHVSQSDYHWNHSEISLLPAMCHGVIALSEKVAITKFSYSDFVVWTEYDQMIDTIKHVLTNYDQYFNNLQKNPQFDTTLANMEETATQQLLNFS